MKISDAKAIPIKVIVDALGGRFSRKGRRGELWYYSPFRPDEKTASFQIDEAKNRWHDFGLAGKTVGAGGDIIDLWCDYYNLDRKAGVKDALKGLEPYTTIPLSSEIKPFRKVQRSKEVSTNQADEPRFKIVKLHNGLFFENIKSEVARRKITLSLASKYLKQVYLHDIDQPARKLNGFAFQNDKGGYEISIPNQLTGKSFKTSTTPKWFTTIKGKDDSIVCVFEGFWDFLTWMEMEKAAIPPNTAYVLNSVSFTGYLVERLLEHKGILKTVKLFTDNDVAGRQSAMQIAEELDGSGILVGTMEQSYVGYKDLNEIWQMRK